MGLEFLEITLAENDALHLMPVAQSGDGTGFQRYQVWRYNNDGRYKIGQLTPSLLPSCWGTIAKVVICPGHKGWDPETGRAVLKGLMAGYQERGYHSMTLAIPQAIDFLIKVAKEKEIGFKPNGRDRGEDACWKGYYLFSRAIGSFELVWCQFGFNATLIQPVNDQLERDVRQVANFAFDPLVNVKYVTFRVTRRDDADRLPLLDYLHREFGSSAELDNEGVAMSAVLNHEQWKKRQQ